MGRVGTQKKKSKKATKILFTNFLVRFPQQTV